MKKFKKFISVMMLLLAAVLAFELVDGKQLITRAASSSKVASPVLRYAYANSNGDVTVAFKKVNKATKYRVYRKTSNTKWKKLIDTKKTTVVDKTAKKGVKYMYTVKACRVTSKNTYWSKYVNKVTSVKKYPSTPTLKSAKATAKGIKVSWKATKNTTKYRVYRKTANSKWKRVKTTTSTTYTDTNFKSGTKYYYTVRAIKVCDGKEYISGYKKSGVSCTSYYPGTPKMALAMITSTGVHVQWSNVKNETSYIVYRKSANTEWAEVARVGKNVICYVDDTAKDYESYYYTVQAINKVNGKTYYGSYNTKGIKTGRTESSFKMSSITLNKLSKPIIKWASYEGSAGYVVYRRTNNEIDYTKMAELKSSKTSYTDWKASKDTEYTYVVKPYFTDSSNAGLYAIGKITTSSENGNEGEVNINPSSTKSPSSSTTNNSVKTNKKAKDMLNNVIKSEYYGKSLSVMGDSISSHSQYNSNAHYSSRTMPVSKMWWQITADRLGMDIEKINAVSGRRVSKTGSGNTSAVERWYEIGNPDVLICYVGTNDFIHGVELGDFPSDINSTDMNDTDNFTGAYVYMINKIRQSRPNTEIILCTLPSSLSSSKASCSIGTFNARIRTIANKFGLSYIDFSSLSFSGIHPNANGQSKLAQKAINKLK